MSPQWGETMVNFGRRPPEPWRCPTCDVENRAYMNQCTRCGERRPRSASGRVRSGIVNLASHKEATGEL